MNRLVVFLVVVAIIAWVVQLMNVVKQNRRNRQIHCDTCGTPMNGEATEGHSYYCSDECFDAALKSRRTSSAVSTTQDQDECP